MGPSAASLDVASLSHMIIPSPPTPPYWDATNEMSKPSLQKQAKEERGSVSSDDTRHEHGKAAVGMCG